MGMGNMEIDRRAFIASLGGMAVVDAMDSETKAEALERLAKGDSKEEEHGSNS